MCRCASFYRISFWMKSLVEWFGILIHCAKFEYFSMPIEILNLLKSQLFFATTFVWQAFSSRWFYFDSYSILLCNYPLKLLTCVDLGNRRLFLIRLVFLLLKVIKNQRIKIFIFMFNKFKFFTLWIIGWCNTVSRYCSISPGKLSFDIVFIAYDWYIFLRSAILFLVLLD